VAVDLSEVLKSDALKVAGLTIAATVIVAILGIAKEFLLKQPIGRKAKQANLFDRYIKEIAVTEAVLKLKLLASEPDSQQQASAKNAAYKQVEELEARQKEELERLTTSGELWWRHASQKEWFIPSFYEGQKHLSLNTKFTWCIYMICFYIYHVVSVLIVVVGFWFLSLGFLAHKNGLALLALPLYFFVPAFLFWHSATVFRRLAYGVVPGNQHSVAALTTTKPVCPP
jgi:hypothetical protein